ncbi:TonB-dependent receptor [Gaopeijia maritima]|uniref:TonB-dependent receptor n=1 Tax=Gaopeijia maritima TaxID=3119007 RepID=A0ABU9E4F4_9BACT
MTRFLSVALRALLVLGILAAPVQAQTSTLTIRTLGPGAEAVEGARVADGQASALTDAAGLARLTLEPGFHRIAIERIGYAHEELEVTLPAGRDTTITVQLELEAMHGEEIVVTSTRTERRIEEEPLRIEVVPREEVEEKLLMTPGDIAMLLNETAGLRVQPTAPSLGGASVRIQGLRGRYTQILSDGLPLYGGQAGALGPLQVPPMDLARVEVIKGAASALYGPTALGGVVNLISRRPARERELILNQSSLDGTDLVGWFADELGDDWGYTLLAGAHRQDHADVDSDGWADLPEFERFSVRPRLFWDDGAGSSVMVTVGGMMEDRAGGTLPGESLPGGAGFVESLDTRRVDAGVNARRLFSDRRVLTVRASGSVQGHEHRYGDLFEEDEHRTAFAEVAMAGQDGRHLWVVGAAVQHDVFEPLDLPRLGFDYTVPALFAQDEVALGDRLTVAGSVRWDHHNRFGSSVSPRLSLLLNAGGWTTRLSGGTGFFAPTPFTEEVEAVGLTRLGTPDYDALEKERARSVMLDVGREVGVVELNVSGFASEIDDPIQTIREADGSLRIANAPESVRTWGTEILASIHSGPWHIVGSHTFLRSTESDPEGEGRREVPLTPEHSLGMIAAFEQEGRGRVGLEVYYTGRQELDDDPYRSTSESHWILGLLVDRRFGPFRFFLNAENILDTRQTEYDRLVRPERTPDGRWITDVWAPLEGRSFNGGVWVAF